MLIDPSGLPLKKTTDNSVVDTTKGEQIFDADQDSFMELVVNASMTIPVLVDFWAPWCEPCKQYTPIIEKAVRAEKGNVRLVKVNVDETEMLAQQLQIRSLPTTMVFVKGQPVQAIPGVLPFDSLKKLLGDLLKMLGKGSSAEMLTTLLQEAEQALNEQQPVAAMELYHQVLAESPEMPQAVAGIIRCYTAQADKDGATEFIATIEETLLSSAEVQSALKGLELLENTDTANITAAKAAVDANPENFDARFALAEAYLGAQNYAEAIEQLLYIVRKDRDWQEKKAREKLLEIFDALGFAHPLAKSGRQQLSSVLFS